jgi:hypothetical protein
VFQVEVSIILLGGIPFVFLACLIYRLCVPKIQSFSTWILLLFWEPFGYDIDGYDFILVDGTSGGIILAWCTD